MEPIINPWVIYFIGVAGGIQVFSGIIGGLLAIVSLVLGIIALVEGERGDLHPHKKSIIKISVVAFALILSCILIPSRNIIIAMIVADNITEDRLVDAGEFAIDIKEAIKADIIEIIQAVEDDD